MADSFTTIPTRHFNYRTVPVSDEVWVAFLYKVLQANDPNQLVKIRQAFGGYDGKAAQKGHQLLDKLLT